MKIRRRKVKASALPLPVMIQLNYPGKKKAHVDGPFEWSDLREALVGIPSNMLHAFASVLRVGGEVHVRTRGQKRTARASFVINPAV